MNFGKISVHQNNISNYSNISDNVLKFVCDDAEFAYLLVAQSVGGQGAGRPG